jgi:hypothetical protein
MGFNETRHYTTRGGRRRRQKRCLRRVEIVIYGLLDAIIPPEGTGEAARNFFFSFFSPVHGHRPLFLVIVAAPPDDVFTQLPRDY